MTLSLNPHDLFPARKPVLIVILDGVGIGRRDEGDAVHLARTPTLDALHERALYTTLKAHGTAVGMPSEGDMGNSEVGHNAIGAGRIFDQGAKLVAEAIDTGAIFEGETWREAVARVGEAEGRTLHLIGLLSDGNVHSHIDHLHAFLERAREEGVQRVRLHVLLDGRDVGSTSALDYVAPTEALLERLSDDDHDYRIASGGGRMFVTMDRYSADWSIVERGWRAHVLGDARRFRSATEAIEAFRAEDEGIIDQHLPPFVVADSSGPIGPIEDGDAVFFMNFRGDRAIEISRAFDEEDFSEFERERLPDVLYAGMMQYDGDLQIPRRFLVTPPDIDRPIGQYLADAGLRQLAVSETQKYGHVTYFWNGNRSDAFDPESETYVEITSDRVDFSERPWMKAAEITDATIARLADCDVARVNYPNGDMVGHTGHLEAAIIAVEATDLALERLLEAVHDVGGVAIVTADHGNADCMFQVDKKTGLYKRDADGRTEPHVSHTLNPVPFWIDDASGLGDHYTLDERLEARGLANIAATVLMLLGFEPPEDYEPALIRPL